MQTILFKNIIALFSVFFILTTSTSTISGQEVNTDLDWIKKAIDITVQDHDVPGLAVAIIRDGKVEQMISRGRLRRDGSKKIDEQTLFQLGSLSKSFTGIIARGLVKDNKLDVDRSIIDFLPETLTAKTVEKLKPITVRDLLHHRSGIPNRAKSVTRVGNDPMVSGYSEANLLKDLEQAKLDFIPGERFSYSNVGFGVAGYVLERAAGKSYEQLVQKYVAAPLGMKNTSTVPARPNMVATPYRKENRFIETKAWKMGKLQAAGGIYSNLNDLTKLMIKQMEIQRARDTKSILNNAVDRRPVADGLEYGWGMFVDGAGKYNHGGDLDGFGTSFMFVPEKNVGIIILTSSGGVMWLPQFEKTLIDKLRGLDPPMPELRKSITIAPKELEKYTGTYTLINGMAIKLVIENGSIVAYPKDDFGPRPMSFASANLLYARTFNAQFEFDMDGAGKILKTTLIFRGQRIPAKRTKITKN